MLASVNRWVSRSAVVALLAVLPGASGAQQEKARQAGEDRWVPSLAVISGFTLQGQEASLAAVSEEMSDPAAVELLVPPVIGRSDDAVSPYVGASLALMSPALPLPGRPRLFLGAEILPTFAASRDIAKVGDPVGFTFPDVPPPPLLDPEDQPGPCEPEDRECYPRTGFAEDLILGNGGWTTAEIDTLVFGATVGVAFPFELLGRPLRVKPSFGWIRYRIDVEGRAARAQCPPFLTDTPTPAPSTACASFDPRGPFDPDDPFRNPVSQPGFKREIELGAQDSQHFNGIGGGLEIEMDTGRVGPFGVSLFLEGRFYRILGDRTVDLSDSVPFEEETVTSVLPPFREASLPAITATANWPFEVEPWMYRAGLGLRLYWLGSRQ
jgi:hypothetical protein